MVKDRLIEIAMTMPLAEADLDLHRDVRQVNKMINQIRNYPCVALPSEDNPVILCGLVHELGMGEVWMLTGSAFPKMWRQVMRQHRQLCATVYEAFNLHRMHMLVDASRPEAGRYAEAVGFEYETTVKRFGPLGVDMSFYLWPQHERNAHGKTR